MKSSLNNSKVLSTFEVEGLIKEKETAFFLATSSGGTQVCAFTCVNVHECVMS